jgi:ubiquinone/menaquinone biosynthesis C-methylase UbiE
LTDTGIGRGYIGTMTALPRFDDESYLDFVEGLRKFAVRTLTPASAAALRGRVAGGGDAVDTADLAQVRAAGDTIPVVSLRNRVLRSTQGMNWQRVQAAYHTHRTRLLAELDAYAGRGPATLQLDEQFEYPRYYDAVDFHRQPGSYHRDALAGYIYHYGTKIFHLGSNDKDESKIANANNVVPPADGKVDRVLDVGCAIGGCTVAFKDRWPDAEVIGVDLSAPLLRYAHMRAVRLGAPVHFRQALAERLPFPDGHFDIVYMSTVLHEMPVADGRRAVAEARRVLRPGGVLELRDMPQAAQPPEPWADYDRDFDTRFNTEPFSYAFIHSDLGSYLEATFEAVSATTSPALTVWRCLA